MTLLFTRAWAPIFPSRENMREALFCAAVLPIVVAGFAAAGAGFAVLYVAGTVVQAAGEAVGVWERDL